MTRDPYFHVQLEAEKLLDEIGISSLPVNPFEIAKHLDIELLPLPAKGGGASGMFVVLGNEFGIGFPTHVKNEGYKRFCVAHELGHYRLPGHVDAVKDVNGRHFSQAAFSTDDQYELEADHFAAALLMPKRLFSQALRRLPDGLRAIETLSKLCVTSLEATAIRYTQCSDEPVAIVVSRGTTINYAFMSQSLQDFPGIRWIKKGTTLPPTSTTADFNENNKRVMRGDQDKGVTSMEDWFGGRSLSITEEVVGLGRYGKTLTVLTGMVSPYETNDTADEDDEALPDTWTPKFK